MRKNNQDCFPRRTSDSQSPDAELGRGDGFGDNLRELCSPSWWVTRSLVLSIRVPHPLSDLRQPLVLPRDQYWGATGLNASLKNLNMQAASWGFSLFTWVWAGICKTTWGSPIPWGLGDINTLRAYPRKLEKAGVTEVLKRVGGSGWLSVPHPHVVILLTNCSYLVVTVSSLEKPPSSPIRTYPHPSWISTFLFFLLFLHGTCFGQWSITEHDRSRGLKCPSVVWLTLLFSVIKRQAQGSPKSKENETCIAHLNLTGAWNSHPSQPPGPGQEKWTVESHWESRTVC